MFARGTSTDTLTGASVPGPRLLVAHARLLVLAALVALPGLVTWLPSVIR